MAEKPIALPPFPCTPSPNVIVMRVPMRDGRYEDRPVSRDWLVEHAIRCLEIYRITTL